MSTAHDDREEEIDHQEAEEESVDSEDDEEDDDGSEGPYDVGTARFLSILLALLGRDSRSSQILYERHFRRSHHVSDVRWLLRVVHFGLDQHAEFSACVKQTRRIKRGGTAAAE